MKSIISNVTWTACIAMLFSLGACTSTHESQGKQIGKKIDHFENSVKDKIDQGKETAHNAKENIAKKTHAAHEKLKDAAHELKS